MQSMQCYSKNQWYAACRPICHKENGWECGLLGVRSPQKTPGAWSGDDCLLTRKCNNAGLQCFAKDNSSAFCSESSPDDWDGELLGGSQWHYRMPPAAEGEPIAGTSLYCIMAVLPGSGEEALQRQAHDLNASIFACESYKVVQSTPSEFVHLGTWNSFANTDSFIEVWRQVFAEQAFRLQDWTVKVDPDTVFIPWRLKQHLETLRPAAKKPIYLLTSEVDFKFLGAIEIMSKVAVQNVAESLEDCRRTMPGKSGEDGFLKGCLDAVGAGAMMDESILRTPHDTNGCGDTSRVAFHPHKDAGSWAGCWGEASR